MNGERHSLGLLTHGKRSASTLRHVHHGVKRTVTARGQLLAIVTLVKEGSCASCF